MEDDGRNEEEEQYFCNNKNVKHNHVGKIEKKIRKNHKSITLKMCNIRIGRRETKQKLFGKAVFQFRIRQV